MTEQDGRSATRNAIGQKRRRVPSQPLPSQQPSRLGVASLIPDKPRRNRPVERDEVMINCGKIQTMPAGTYEPGEFHTWIAIPGLWGQFLEQMVEQARRLQLLGWVSGPRPPDEWLRPFSLSSREYQCQQCGAIYLALRRSRLRLRLCSNRCERLHDATRTRKWRERQREQLDAIGEKPTYNVGRSERRRQARTDLSCVRCGAEMAAARSTRRFCSEACRVAAHRDRHRVVAA